MSPRRTWPYALFIRCTRIIFRTITVNKKRLIEVIQVIMTGAFNEAPRRPASGKLNAERRLLNVALSAFVISKHLKFAKGRTRLTATDDNR
jgi:hypothetical protein